ncbi:MAG: ribonuclease HII [Polyangiaceae bacterium]|nr:ribonuclease HII [Polyangiaceae bacterium]
MKAPTLAELRRLYVDEGRSLPIELERALAADPRAGARALLRAVEARRSAARAEGQRLRVMLRRERELWASGVARVAGVDEAGVSPLAGPVCAAAVILPVGCRLPGVDDSKKLDAPTRARLAEVVKRDAVAWATAFASPEEIDRLNPYHASLLAMTRAVRALGVAPEHLLIDARSLRDVPLPQDAIVGGDGKSLSIAAASILAKTTRDALMIELDATYPGYGLAQHKGYPVKAHVEALMRLGVTPIHRRSYELVREALAGGPRQTRLF